jgi:hypothetical protein
MERHPLDELYEGQPIFILSTGTSLRGFDFSRLDGHLTIGINRIVEYYQPSVLHLVDQTAQHTHADALRRYDGIMICTENAAPAGRRAGTFAIRHNVDTFELSGTATELSTFVGRSFRDGFYGGGAGCTALHTAILLGGDPIYLLGYDFYEDNGRHFDVWDPTQNARELYGIPFHGIHHIARQPWIPRIYNCNPRSRLTCFPFATIDSLPLSPAA